MKYNRINLMKDIYMSEKFIGFFFYNFKKVEFFRALRKSGVVQG